MKEYTDGNFLMSEIIDLDAYKDNYPDNYISQLTPLKILLIDELVAANILSEKRSNDDEAESSYYWTPEMIISESGPDDDGPNSGDDPVTPDFSDPDNLPTAPSFVTDFADFEAFLRQIYFEFVPEDHERKYGPQQLVNRLIEIGILTKTWYSSSKIKEIMDTRNKIVHGESIGPEELNVVQSSIFTLSRLKSEVIKDLTFYISQKYLQSFNLQKNKGGYDFVATRESDGILFDVKYIQAGQPDSRNINEIFDKYSNYALGSSANLQYVLFFFQPNRRKSFDDFLYKFSETINAEHPELKDILNVFYITESDEKGYKEIIEGYLKTVVKKIGPQKNAPATFFTEDEIADTERVIKDKSINDWPSDYSMQVHLIQTQSDALNKLKQLDGKGLGDELFTKLALRSKNSWPDDYIMQLDDFQKQKASFQKVENLICNDIPENILDQILKDAEKSWPNDYEMRIHQIETQIDAFKTLKNLPPDDITEQQFQTIANKAAKEYPKDFEMQLHTLQTQIESIRQLNKK